MKRDEKVNRKKEEKQRRGLDKEKSTKEVTAAHELMDYVNVIGKKTKEQSKPRSLAAIIRDLQENEKDNEDREDMMKRFPLLGQDAFRNKKQRLETSSKYEIYDEAICKQIPAEKDENKSHCVVYCGLYLCQNDIDKCANPKEFMTDQAVDFYLLHRINTQFSFDERKDVLFLNNSDFNVNYKDG